MSWTITAAEADALAELMFCSTRISGEAMVDDPHAALERAGFTIVPSRESLDVRRPGWWVHGRESFDVAVAAMKRKKSEPREGELRWVCGCKWLPSRGLGSRRPTCVACGKPMRHLRVCRKTIGKDITHEEIERAAAAGKIKEIPAP